MAGLVQKPFNVIVYGATGFTGRLICEHIAKDYSGKFTWAMAGRDKAKLDSVRRDLIKFNKNCQDVPIIVADASDIQSLKDMTSKARVVLSTVGPFSKHHGYDLVEACVKSHTHYCDITAEPSFIKRVQLGLDEEAQENGVKIVHCCGFDSIPADLGTYVLVDYCKTKLGKRCAEVHTSPADIKGGLSGGTLESAMYLMTGESQEVRQAMTSDMYYLVRDRTKVGSEKHAPIWPTWDPVFKSWTAPFFMEFINAKVVQWSNALANPPYGSSFRVVERDLSSSFIAAVMVSLGTIMAALLIINPLTRPLLRRMLPQPGQGPSRELMLNGKWTYKLAAVTEEPAGKPPTIVKLTVQDAHRDPGYWGTARMILECGLALSLQEEALVAAGLPRGGVMSPAAAMGPVLVERLKGAGITFEINQS